MSTSRPAEPTVLVIGDKPGERSRGLEGLLGAASNMRVRKAENGREAMAYLSRVRGTHSIPRLIVLDLDNLKESGFEVLSFVKSGEATNQIPVIVFTSFAEARDIERAYSLGASTCLLKTADEACMYGIAKGIGDFAEILKDQVAFGSSQHAGNEASFS